MDDRPRRHQSSSNRPSRRGQKPWGKPRGGGGRGGGGHGGGRGRHGGGKPRERPTTSLIDPAALQRGPKSRFQALEILEKGDTDSTFVDALLEQRIRDGRIAAEDKHLVQEIVFGAIRHRNTLDQVLEAYLHFAMTRQHVAARWALRLAAYQLVYLCRIPSHAAIHGTIEALKATRGMEQRDVGFVNAVLRRLSADIESKSEDEPHDPSDPKVVPARHGYCYFKRPVLPAPANSRTIFLALKHSHPKWLMSRWVARFGEEDATALCQANNRVPLVTAVLTSKAPSREAVVESLQNAGVEIEDGVLPEALRLRRTGDIRELEAYREGWIRIQDETATVIGNALDPEPGSRVLDLCAAPGGKAAQILERIGDDGHLVACDVDAAKIARLNESLERVGRSYTVLKLPPDPNKIELDETFPYVLVDVPCSNTGVLARRPEARWRVHDDDLTRIATIQGRLLDAAVRLLAPGGRLVYSTCSIEPEENGQVVSAALRRHSQLVEESSRLFLPHRDGADGGYYAILSSRA